MMSAAAGLAELRYWSRIGIAAAPLSVLVFRMPVPLEWLVVSVRKVTLEFEARAWPELIALQIPVIFSFYAASGRP